MHVEVLKPQHWPEIHALVEAIHAQQGLLAQFYWPKEMLEAELRTGEAIGVMAGERIQGVVLYRQLPEAWEISLVATHPLFQGQGAMSFLFAHLIDAKGQGKELWLEVHEENVPAQKLYEKLGFREIRRRPRYYKDGATAILYSRA